MANRIIFFGVFQYENVRVSMDGKLEIGLVRTEAHKGQYNCTAYDVSGRQCGITDSFDLNVVSLCKLFHDFWGTHSLLLCLLYA